MSVTPQARQFPGKIVLFLLVLCHFLAPLVFFTDLTRNPYFTQIAVINIAVLLTAALWVLRCWKNGEWIFKPAAPDTAFLAWIAVCLAGWACAYLGHAAFFRPAIFSEGLKKEIFTIVNCFGAYWFARYISFSDKTYNRRLGLACLLFVWGALWIMYPGMRQSPPETGILNRIFDPYGTLLWGAGLVAAMFIALRATQEDFILLVLTVGGLAAGYGILQNFGFEVIWPKVLNPYGSRAVSTFGNPNFLSSYLVMLLPLAAVYYLKQQSGLARIFYGMLFLAYEGSLLSSLTRSSWIGAAAAVGFLFFFKDVRAAAKTSGKWAAGLGLLALLMVLLWPSSSVGSYHPSVFGRMKEMSALLGFALAAFAALAAAAGLYYLKTAYPLKKWIWPALIIFAVAAAFPVKTNTGYRLAANVAGSKISAGIKKAFSLPEKESAIYSPWHQRLLIWTSCARMGFESPVIGQGWGLLELLYPYYQGPIVLSYPAAKNLRTHANNAHNEIVELWCQTGIVGIGVYLWLFVSLAWAFSRYYKTADGDKRLLGLAFAAALIGMLADNMLNVSAHFAVPAFLFWWLAGALAALVSGSACKTVRWDGRVSNSVLAVAALAMFSAGIYLWFAQWMREVYYFQGFKFMRREAVSQGIESLEKAYKWNHWEVNNNYELANAYARAQQYDKALAMYNSALAANAGYDEIFFNKGIILGKRIGDIPGAIQAFQMSLWINPYNPQVYSILSDLYLKNTAVYASSAVDTAEQAVRAFPANANLYNTLGYFYIEAKTPAKALAVFEKGLELDPFNDMLDFNMRKALAELKLSGNEMLARASELKRIRDLLRNGQSLSAALDSAGRYARRYPQDLNGALMLARVHYLRGENRLARGILERLVSDGKESPVVYLALAAVCERGGDMSAAKSWYEKVLTLEPGNKTVADRIANLRPGLEPVLW